MAKERDETSSKKKSPVSIAEEAIAAGLKPEDDNTIPAVVFPGGMNPSDVSRKLTDELLNSQLSVIRMNEIERAATMSERYKLEEKQKLDEAKSPGSKVSSAMSAAHPQVNLGGGGILAPIAGSDRAAIVDAALKNLSSDEAKLKFINDHPEYFESGPAPFSGVPRAAPVKQEPSADPVVGVVSAMDNMSKMIYSNLTMGMELRDKVNAASAPAPNNSMAQVVDAVKIAETFRQMSENQGKMFEGIVKGITDQNKAILESMQQRTASLEAKLLETKQAAFDAQQAHLKEELDQMRAAMSRGPSFSFDDIAKLSMQARDNGIPITTITPEQQVVNARIERENREFDHKLTMEEKRMEIERVKEERRLAALSGFKSMFDMTMEPAALKRHAPSSSAVSVAERL